MDLPKSDVAQYPVIALFDSEQSSHLMESINPISVPEMYANLSSLNERECQHLLNGGTDAEVEYPKDSCVHHLFEAQAELTPEAVSLVFNDEHVTYRELNQRANRLAHHLLKLGVGREVLVGILVERSVEMVIGLLGVLKAGGAYVPLDPAYPQERLCFMMADAAAKVVLTQERLVESLPLGGARAICLDKVSDELAGESVENPESDATAESPAYVMYTSGSTGKPKGVVVPHRAILRLLFGVDYVQLNAAETFLQLAPVSFDASTFEIWGALLHGAKCVLFPGCVPTFKELGEAIKKNHVSILWLTSSLFNAVIDGAPETLSPVRQLLIGGEALSVPHVRRALELFPSQQIINGYGPTEGTTFTCCYRIPHQLKTDTRSIPIGRPIANTQIYILDELLQLVPLGEPGELYIGGSGLAHGYLNRPELTAERFVPNPFHDHPTTRLYKTGDLVRRLPDGNIEFLGRIDQQVKIRGFRIELGEIEAVLGMHSCVSDTAVVAREDVPGNKRLVAYMVPITGQTVSVSDLRQYLKRKLPEYMIPSAFVWLERMPLTLNGKLDRQALPLPESKPETRQAIIEPRTEMERAVARGWQEVMRLDHIDMDDNLFDLGVHSLQMVQALEKLNATLRTDFSITRMFQYPTIRSLAKYLTQELSEQPLAGKIHDRVQKQKEALAQRKQLVRGRHQ